MSGHRQSRLKDLTQNIELSGRLLTIYLTLILDRRYLRNGLKFLLALAETDSVNQCSRLRSLFLRTFMVTAY